MGPATYNPRTISEEALKGLQESIKRYGLVQPIIVNSQTMGYKVYGSCQLTPLQRHVLTVRVFQLLLFNQRPADKLLDILKAPGEV